jgi:hypothetical protein
LDFIDDATSRISELLFVGVETMRRPSSLQAYTGPSGRPLTLYHYRHSIVHSTVADPSKIKETQWGAGIPVPWLLRIVFARRDGVRTTGSTLGSTGRMSSARKSMLFMRTLACAARPCWPEVAVETIVPRPNPRCSLDLVYGRVQNQSSLSSAGRRRRFVPVRT